MCIRDSLYHSLPTIAAGDFNSKHPLWNSPLPGGCSLYSYVQRRPQVYVPYPTSPTHVPKWGLPDVHNIAVIKDLAYSISIEVGSDPS